MFVLVTGALAEPKNSLPKETDDLLPDRVNTPARCCCVAAETASADAPAVSM